MDVTVGLTSGPCNTKYAPLAAMAARFQQDQRLMPLHQVQVAMKKVDFSPMDKLQHILVSMLAGCEYISEVNIKLSTEHDLARAWSCDRFAEQSILARTLDRLTLTNLDQLRQAVLDIWRPHSRTLRHDWRGLLWLDMDLSGLPCGKQAEGSTKGYFSGKKTPPVAKWHGSVP